MSIDWQIDSLKLTRSGVGSLGTGQYNPGGDPLVTMRILPYEQMSAPDWKEVEVPWDAWELVNNNWQLKTSVVNKETATSWYRNVVRKELASFAHGGTGAEMINVLFR